MQYLMFVLLTSVLFLKTSDTIAAEIAASAFDQRDLLQYTQDQFSDSSHLVAGDSANFAASMVWILLILGLTAFAVYALSGNVSPEDFGIQ